MNAIETTKKATIMTVLNGLLTRYDTLCRRAHNPGLSDSVFRLRSRIMDVIAALYNYDDDRIPDVLHVTHGHRIYRVDFTEGRFDLIGTLTVDLTLAIAPVIEVN
jgi:hypothetical protein